MYIKKSKIILNILSIIICLIMVFIIPVSYATDNLTDAEKTRQALQKRNQELTAELEKAKKDSENVKAQEPIYQEKIKIVEQQIDLTNESIAELDNDINLKNQEISLKQGEIDKSVELLKQRIRAVYICGESYTLDIILKSKDFDDFLIKTDMLKIITKHDQDLINNLKSQLDNLEKQKEAIEKRRLELNNFKKELSSQRQELDKLIEESKTLLLVYSADQDIIYDIMDKNDEELKRIESQIEAYYRNGSYKSPDTGIVDGKGMFAWPVPGFTYISSYWGDNRGHEAIDIAGAGIYGADIIAPADGVVIFCNSSGWGGGYGNYVMIDHGKGYATLCAHMSSTAVELGQTVKRGQTIGHVGSTGDSTGPHLHFEVRINGVKHNPLDFY